MSIRNVTYWSIQCNKQRVRIVSGKNWSAPHSFTQWNNESTSIKYWNLTTQNTHAHTRTWFKRTIFYYTVTLWKHLGTAGLRLLKQGFYTFKHCFQNQKTPNSSVLLDSNNALPRTFRLQYLHVQQFTTPKATLVTEILAVVTELTIPINVLTWKLIIH